MTNLERSQQLHKHACDLEDRLEYYRKQGNEEAAALIEPQAMQKRLQYLEALIGAMDEV